MLLLLLLLLSSPLASSFLLPSSPSPSLSLSSKPSTPSSSPNRRALLSSSLLTPFLPLPSLAAPAASPVPDDSRSLGGAAVRIHRYFRPKPLPLLRSKLSLPFAVTLMRSSYTVLDELDLVAMDTFQKSQFLIRQSEWQQYKADIDQPVVQGDLTSPDYFDFMSFIQYSAIDREFVSPPRSFVEQQMVEVGEGEAQAFKNVTVARSLEIPTKELPAEFERRVGLRILSYLHETFDETNPLPSGGGDLSKSLRKLVDLFLVSGFALSGTVTSPSPSTYTLSLTSPATAWSEAVLLKEGARAPNSFLAMAAVALLKEYGVEAEARSEVKGNVGTVRIRVK